MDLDSDSTLDFSELIANTVSDDKYNKAFDMREFENRITDFIKGVNRNSDTQDQYTDLYDYVKRMIYILWRICVNDPPKSFQKNFISDTCMTPSAKTEDMILEMQISGPNEEANRKEHILRISLLFALLFQEGKSFTMTLETNCGAGGQTKTFKEDNTSFGIFDGDTELRNFVSEMLQKMLTTYKNAEVGSFRCVKLSVGRLTIFSVTLSNNTSKFLLGQTSDNDVKKKLQSIMKTIVTAHGGDISPQQRIPKAVALVDAYKDVVNAMTKDILDSVKLLEEKRKEDLRKHKNDLGWSNRSMSEEMIEATYYARRLDAEVLHMTANGVFADVVFERLKDSQANLIKFYTVFSKALDNYKACLPLLNILFRSCVQEKIAGHTVLNLKENGDSLKYFEFLQCNNRYTDNSPTSCRVRFVQELMDRSHMGNKPENFFIHLSNNTPNMYVDESKVQVPYMIICTSRDNSVQYAPTAKKFYKSFYSIGRGFTKIITERIESAKQIEAGLKTLKDYKEAINTQKFNSELCKDIYQLTETSPWMKLSGVYGKFTNTQVRHDGTWLFETQMNPVTIEDAGFKTSRTVYRELLDAATNVCHEFDDCLFLPDNNPMNYEKFKKTTEGMVSLGSLISLYHKDTAKVSLQRFFSKISKARRMANSGKGFIIKEDTFLALVREMQNMNDLKTGNDKEIFRMKKAFLLEIKKNKFGIKEVPLVFQFNIPANVSNRFIEVNNKWLSEFLIFCFLVWQPTILGDRVNDHCVNFFNKNAQAFLGKFFTEAQNLEFQPDDLIDEFLTRAEVQKNKRLRLPAPTDQDSNDTEENFEDEYDEYFTARIGAIELLAIPMSGYEGASIASLGRSLESLRLVVKKGKV